MLLLQLKNITKIYRSSETVTALRGVTVSFRQNEFVSILGPSGCGKTTLLNIIGGLDRYNSGNLLINGISTHNFWDRDWDAYRNRSIGFVFQTYNLITHQTVLQNVEIALTLSGVSAGERRRRAKQALADVGLSDQLRKKPSQLSGGQMQRVAIARALVNNPDIILADEPTGALDSHTSTQIMEILRQVAKTRLVIMVTHNGELADKYSTRIIRMLDGEILADTAPAQEEQAPHPEQNKAKAYKKTSMSFVTAALLSFKNLMTKRGRTVITAFAGSIGIIGVALVLALSNGLSLYMANMQSSTLSGFPVSVTAGEQTIDLSARTGRFGEKPPFEEYPSGNVLYAYDSAKNSERHTNVLTEDYISYVNKMPDVLPNAVNNITLSYGVDFNLLAKGADSVVKFNIGENSGFFSMAGTNTYWHELPANSGFVLSVYDLLGEGSRLPQNKNEVVLVVDKYNRINKTFYEKLGIVNNTEKYQLTDFIGKTILKVIPNNAYYHADGELFKAAQPSEYTSLYTGNEGIPLTIVGILRLKKDVSSSYLSTGIAYSTALTQTVLEQAASSDIALAQSKTVNNILLGAPFSDAKAKKEAMQNLGASTSPVGINIYPKDYASKDSIKNYLDAYNTGKAKADQVVYLDMAETIASISRTLLDIVTYVLVGFAAISLVVSTIMIAIIIYVSVIERTREIGILRSVGARKKDISRVFNAEAVIIGLAAGLLGVGVSYLLTIPINKIIIMLVDIPGIANFSPYHAVALVLGSMALTLLAGFIPSRIAAQKDPVVALRAD